MIDPSKDKFAYFKDNIQTAEDKEDFDASQYYYHRDEFGNKGLSASSGPGGLNASANSSLGGSGAHLSLSAFHSMGSGLVGGMDVDANLAAGGQADPSLPPMHGSFSGFNGAGMMQGGSSSQFLGGSGVGRMPVGGAVAMPPSPNLHRMSSGDALASVVKGRNFQMPTENKAPDMSEFPALGSRMGSLSLDSGFDGSASGGLRSQPSEFVIQKEDFPALSTFGPGSNEKSTMQSGAGELKRHASFTSSAADGMVSGQRAEQHPGGNSSIGSRVGSASAAGAGVGQSASGAAGSGNNNSVALGGDAFDNLHAPRPEDKGNPTESSSNGELDPSNQYGLLGMLNTIIRSDSDSKKNPAMGCDLTSLGLNLNSAEPLYPTFASPWADSPLTKEPQYSLPMCYYNQPPVLKTTHLSKFHLETLFFIFYSMPKDVLQAYAAQELYTREWRYHAELKTWLKRASPADTALLANSSNSTSTGNASTPVSGGAPSGNGSIGSIGSALGSSTGPSLANSSLGPQFLFFDTTTWERRVFTGNIHSVSAGLMGEEEIRVKFNGSS